MVGAIKEKKRKTQMWGRHSKRLYLCTVPTNVGFFFLLLLLLLSLLRDVMPSGTQKPFIEENFSGNATSHPWQQHFQLKEEAE